MIKHQMLSFIHALVQISFFLSCATIAAGERYEVWQGMKMYGAM
jgi:hypothetical protein